MEPSTTLNLQLICDGDKCGQDEVNYELKMTKTGGRETDWKKQQLGLDKMGLTETVERTDQG